MLFPELQVERQSHARFSKDRVYRYSLWRSWEKDKPMLGALLLNPSTADEEVNDPTISRLVHRAKLLGFGALVVVNLFAFRATSPEMLLHFAGDPVGPENDEAIIVNLCTCRQILAGWGAHGKHQGRSFAVEAMLARCGLKLHCLSINSDGSPCHPLYQPYKNQLFPLEAMRKLI